MVNGNSKKETDYTKRWKEKKEVEKLKEIVGLDKTSDFACTVSSCSVRNPSVCPLGQTCWMNTPKSPFETWNENYGEPPLWVTDPYPSLYPYSGAESQVIEEMLPGSDLNPSLVGAPSTLGQAITEVGRTLPGIPSSVDVGKWYTGEKILEAGFSIAYQYFAGGGPLMVFPETLLRNHPMYRPKY